MYSPKPSLTFKIEFLFQKLEAFISLDSSEKLGTKKRVGFMDYKSD